MPSSFFIVQVWADSDTVDLDYDRFLNGQAAIPYALLKGINISIFHRLFALLTKPHHDKIHAVLLVFMIEQCRVKIKLESIDGVNFFKGLVDSRDPVIA